VKILIISTNCSEHPMPVMPSEPTFSPMFFTGEDAGKSFASGVSNKPLIHFPFKNIDNAL
jgi:hypothetical protein